MADRINLVEKLAARAFDEAGPEVLTMEVWAKGARWWLKAIADELKAVDTKPGDPLRIYGTGGRAAAWLRSQAEAPTDG